MKRSLTLQKVRNTMENKNEKSMALEEMIGEMLKDAKVVKIHFLPRQRKRRKISSRTSPSRCVRLVPRSFRSTSKTCTSTWMSA